MRRERSFLILLVLGIALGAYIYFVERKRPAGEEAEQKPKVFENVQEADIEEMVVTADGETTRLKKSGDKWQIVEPVTAPANREAANNLTGNFATLERNEVVEENPASVKDFGLDPPRAIAGFRVKNSKELRRLHIGSRAPTGGDLYARVDGEKRVLLISGFMDGVFVKKTFDLRDKTALAFDRDKIDALQIETPGRKIRLTHGPSEWRIAEPLQVRADFGTAEGIVGRLAIAQMRTLVSDSAPDATALRKYGLDKPDVTVTVTGGSAQSVLKIGANKDADGNPYAMDASRPMVFTLESSLAEELKKPVGDLRRKDLFEFRPFNATRVELTRDGQTSVFELVKNADKNAPTTDKWRLTSPSARDLDRQKMDSFLSGFSNLRVDSWTEKAAVSGTTLSFVVKFDEGKKEERVVFTVAGDNVTAARADEPGSATLSKTDFDTATRTLSDLLAPPPTAK